MSDREFRKSGETIQAVKSNLRNAVARGNSNAVKSHVDELLAEQGIMLDASSKTYARLSASIIKIYAATIEQLAQRQAGVVVDTPQEPPAFVGSSAAAEKNNPPLSQVFEMYKAEKQQLSPKTIMDFTPNIRRFIELHGDVGIKDINRDHIRGFKDAMVLMPARPSWKLRALPLPEIIEKTRDDPTLKRLSPKTVNEKALATLSAVIGWADDQGLRDGNPAKGLKIKGGKYTPKSRLSYTIDELNTIFRFHIFTEGERPKGGAGEAAKWLPLLGLFTGARLEELGQLLVQDVQMSAEGIWFLDMITLDKGQRLKTDASRRRVPIHRQLIELGFLRYVEDQRDSPERWLFPKLKSTRLQRTAAFSQWWGKYPRQHGITDRRKVFHSFRHTLKDAFRESEVPKELFDAIQGHGPRDVSDGYGQGYSLRRLAEAMEKVRFEGLDISHLATHGSNSRRSA